MSNNNMKILRVIPSMDPKIGGPCQGIRNSIPAMANFGAVNEVVCLDDPNSSYLGQDSFTIYTMGPSKTSWAYSKKLIPWLKKNAINYDAVIVHGLWQYTGYAVCKALKLIKNSPPYFVMPHGMLDPYFQKAPERRLKAIRNWMFWKFIEYKVVNNAEGVLFTCEEELLLARTTFSRYKPNAELNVGYGIQKPPEFKIEMTNAFHTQCKNLNGKPYLLFLSRIHPKKGLDLLLEAYSKYVIEFQNCFDLVIAGPGMDTEFGQSLQYKVNTTSHIKDKVHITGMLSGNAKWGAFYNSEAFILPSHQENFGIAIVEALACSKPVLISNKVNIWREINLSQAGFIVNDDTNAVFLLIKKFIKLSEDEYERMSLNSKLCFEKYYEIEPAAQRLLKTIQIVLND